MIRGRDLRIAAAIALAVLAAHVAFFAIVFHGDVPPAGDTPAYREPALHLLAGRGYSIDGVHPTANRPPGYSLFLAAVYGFGGSDRVAVLVQMAVMAAAGAALYGLARRRLPEAEGAAIALLLSLDADVLFWSSFVLSDALALAILVVALLVLDLARARRSALLAAVSGVALGGGLLVRPSYVAAVPAAILFLSLAVRPRRFGALMTAAMALGIVLALAPWTIRNAVDLAGFYPLSTEGGINLYAGVVWREGAASVDDTFEPEVLAAVRGMGETEADRYLRERAVRRILAEPLPYAALGARKLWTTWQPTYARFSVGHQTLDLLWYVVLVGGTVLFIVLRPRPFGDIDLAMAAIFLGINALIAVTYADPEFRYRLPTVLPLAWAAGQGWPAALRFRRPAGRAPGEQADRQSGPV